MFINDWSCLEDMCNDFQDDIDTLLDSGDEILLASYTNEDYDGYAFVLFRKKDGSLHEVNGSHCSCYGLEDQWNPEPTTFEELAYRLRESEYSFTGCRSELAALIEEHEIKTWTNLVENDDDDIDWL